ncbi:hypothetical protein PAT3040_02264 [Paenibacillus agaridevorans]|uniref:Sporulation stage II protein D amidase enhancer LytB N-terminal domain-containing protein n=1 Tax=Paenibacillus agaridevorans TaxID=171404 RepID=A0A2R5EM09_9BACL|nr:hypothetical protein [Paenibacillus agaridevorans]GBG07706.1 hypothetical protein PAT3040_02264 [Paenibacillus agaridevorans]
MIRKIGTLAITLSLLVASSLQAAPLSKEQQFEIVQTVMIDQNTEIKKFEDGRIAPIDNAKILNEEQLNKILVQMNVPTEEINNFPLGFKKKLVERGGLYVEVNRNFKEYYNDSQGIKHEVTEGNRNNIQTKVSRDIESLKAPGMVNLLSDDSVSDGIFTAQTYVFYLGKTATNAEFKYDYYTSYNWSRLPANSYTDIIAQSWQSHTTSVASNGAHNWYPDWDYYCTPGYTWVQDSYGTNLKNSIGGSQAKFSNHAVCEQYGALHNEVRIPVTHAGETGQFIATYAHPFIGGLGYAVMNYLSIDFGFFIGNEWEMINTFTIQT